jgi:RNA polymerase sigma-70 factor (ECF subfamily)
VYIDELGTQERAARLVVETDMDPEQDLMKREMADFVRKEVVHLPPIMRNVILLRDLDGLPLADVALRLGVTVPAVKSRLVRARLEMRERLARKFGVSESYAPSIVNMPPSRSPRCNFRD